eukprot:scaffold310754_cov31-Tisochrysis_lutea.AAC.1
MVNGPPLAVDKGSRSAITCEASCSGFRIGVQAGVGERSATISCPLTGWALSSSYIGSTRVPQT